MANKIESLSIQSGSAKYDSPETLLLRCLQDVQDKDNKDPFAVGKKMIVIGLADDKEDYEIRWSQCGMTMVECASLVRATEHLLLSEFL